ncbi:MAG: hypothetical protein ACM3PP_04075 [Candidatus Saccharibacteria bacterium]
MALDLQNLDTKTRRLMLEELQLDIDNRDVYISSRLNEKGAAMFTDLLKKSIDMGSSNTFALDLKLNGCFNTTEPRSTKTGGITKSRMPDNAHEILAEREYNRYYARAVCRRADAISVFVEVYKARELEGLPPEVNAMVGKQLDPTHLLESLRRNKAFEPSIGLPSALFSGLSIRMVRPV